MRIQVLTSLIVLAVGRPVVQGQIAATNRVQTPVPPVSIYQSERRELGGALAADSMPRVLYVALPDSYRDSVTKRYPVVLVLDGDGVFGMASGIERFLRLREEIPEIILVGVANGIPFLETVPFRLRNFPPTPTSAHPGSGHASQLLAYLTREVVPFVDSLYRTVPSDRTLMGISRSGLFVLYALYEQQGVFRRMVAASPEVIWDNKSLFRRDSTFAGSKRPLPVSLYVSVGGEELARPGGAAVREFGDLLNARKYEGMSLFMETLPGETHNSAMGTAITHGLKAVFRDSRRPVDAPSGR
jgi:predicted alpha/beta superfamily hydrolase